MTLITKRAEAEEIIKNAASNHVSLAIFCTASHWNTEAILIAADNFAKKHNIKQIPVVIAMTFTYQYMPQASRVTRSNNPQVGFISIMEHIKALCEREDSPYHNVTVLTHLDHADPIKDKWGLTEGLPYLTSVMFDAQKYPYKDNIKMTREYIKEHGHEVLVEGIMDVLSVSGGSIAKSSDNYVEKATEYIKSTHVDFLVADLGTEQQSTTVGVAKYLKQRARNLTDRLGKPMLVLHGTSCLNDDQINGLPDDGIIRVNMWTRIAREAGQYAAERLIERIDGIREGNFEDAESKQYLYDNIDKAAEIMEKTMGLLGYANLVKET